MKFVPNQVTRVVGRNVLVVQKNSPTILFGAGVVGVVATVVLASRATLKVEEVLTTGQKDLAMVEEVSHANYSKSDQKHDISTIKIRTALGVAKLYAPAVVVGTFSIAALTGSHHIMSKRNAAVTAAYATIEKAFDRYRERVVDELGEEKDLEFRHGSELKIVADPNKKDKDKAVTTVGPFDRSGYERFFDQYNINWQNNADLNLFFIKCQQNWANDRLRARGWVLLNEVYKSLGLEETKAGCVVGWYLNGDGDNYIDFGVFDASNDKARDFVNGRENAILLDFNVDGVIYDKI